MMMESFTLKLRYFLVLLILGTSTWATAAPDETEYVGELVYSGYYDDGDFGPYPIGFDFEFFGNSYNQFYINTNGQVLFGAGSFWYVNRNIPNNVIPQNYIAPFWDDLVIDDSGDIMYQTIGTAPNRKLIVQFRNMSFWANPDLLGSIQVILYEGSNEIQVQYRNLINVTVPRTSGSSATIGLENSTGTVGVQCSYNTAGYVYGGRAIRFSPDAGSYTYDENALYEPVALTGAIPEAGPANMLTPVQDAIVDEDVDFAWEPASNASSYRVIISLDPYLTSPLHTSADLTGLGYSYTLASGSVYYWTVESINAAGVSTLSEIRSFQTSSTAALTAVSQTVFVEQDNMEYLTLRSTGGDGSARVARLTSLPSGGTLYQNNGGLPGDEITTVPILLSAPDFTLFYDAPDDNFGNGLGSFDFEFSNLSDTSQTATCDINVLPLGIPNFVYAARAVDRVEITFDRNMADPTGKHLEFAVQENTVDVGIDSCKLKEFDARTIVLYLATDIDVGNSITVAYTQGTVQAASGGVLETFDFQLAGKLSQDITFEAEVGLTYGDPDYTLTATATSGLPVSFSSSNPDVVAVFGTTASVKEPGECIMIALQPGDATYAAARREVVQQVSKLAATLNVNNLSQEYTGAGISVDVTTNPAGLNYEVSYNGSPALPVDTGTYAVFVEVVEDYYTGSQAAQLDVFDATAPVPDVSPLPDIIEECDATPVAPTATDFHDGPITGTTTTAFPITAQGTTVITWTYTDGAGNSTTQNQNVLIDDVTDPVTPVLADLSDECSLTAVEPTTTDNCAGTLTGTTADPLTYEVQGAYVINWTFDDGNGNTITVPQNVLIDDVTDPVTPVLADLSDECSLTAVEPTTTDNCAGTLTGTTTDPLTYEVQGSYVINWTFDDGNGNTITVPQNVVIDDVTDPVTPVLADLSDECSLTAVEPTTTDNCAGTLTGTTTDPLTYEEQGSYVINWTFDDGNGNTITVPQNVLIDDVTDPVTPVLADLSDECSLTAVEPTTTDNCAGTLTGTTTDPLTYEEQGSYVINWTFDDGNGNTITVPQNVVIDDVTDPVTPVLADLSDECSLTAVEPTTTDNCAGTLTGTTTDPLTYEVQGSYVINWTFDDGNGNTITVPQNVLIDDVTPPTATAPADVVTCDGSAGDISLSDVSDNCTAAPTVTFALSGATTGTGSGDASGEVFAPGVTTVTYTVADDQGNSSTYDLTVDNQAVGDIVVTLTGETLTVETSGTYQWIDCEDDSEVSGETGSSFTPATSGDYAVIVTQGACSDTSDCVTVTLTGLGETESGTGYQLYPNPAGNQVNLSMDQEQVHLHLKVFDMTGHLIHEVELEHVLEHTLDISSYKPGIYLIQLQGEDFTGITRLMKE
jgi:hypothetical protein